MEVSVRIVSLPLFLGGVNMKKLVKIFIRCFLVLVLCVGFSACADKDNDPSEPIALPQFLYNSKAECIAFTHDEKYLRNYETREHIATYDFDLNIFISTDGKYFGEIKYDNVLLYNTNSEHKSINRGTQPLAPLSPTPGLAGIRGLVGILGLGWEDVLLEKETTPPITPSTKYTLTLSNIGQGATNGGGSYEAGKSIEITAIPDDGYYFHGWYIDTENTVMDNPYTFAMPNETYILIAIFSTTPPVVNPPITQSYTLTVSKTDGGWISGDALVMTSGVSVSNQYASGRSITLNAWTNSGYIFDGWYQGLLRVSTLKTYPFTMPSNNLTLQAKFIQN